MTEDCELENSGKYKVQPSSYTIMHVQKFTGLKMDSCNMCPTIVFRENVITLSPEVKA